MPPYKIRIVKPDKFCLRYWRRQCTTCPSSAAAPPALPWRSSLPENCRIAVLSKDIVTEGSTVYAQGGISAVLDVADSVDSHIEDTVNAGADLCDPEAVRFTVENGAKSIQWLLDAGVPFTREDNAPERLHLTREGGHSHRRISHAADALAST